jgi:hypothetical protein
MVEEVAVAAEVVVTSAAVEAEEEMVTPKN